MVPKSSGGKKYKFNISLVENCAHEAGFELIRSASEGYRGLYYSVSCDGEKVGNLAKDRNCSEFQLLRSAGVLKRHIVDFSEKWRGVHAIASKHSTGEHCIYLIFHVRNLDTHDAEVVLSIDVKGSALSEKFFKQAMKVLKDASAEVQLLLAAS